MVRYIDFHLIGELVDSHGNVHYEDLKNLPTADVVEVVRCVDCKWYKKFCPFLKGIERIQFCSLGERREGDKG